MTKMLFVEDDDVIEAISASRDRPIPYAHGSKTPDEGATIRAIAITNDILWRFIPTAGFG
jgi:hypothetical protein